MIKILPDSKMFQKFVIFPLLFVAIQAAGELSIVNSPNSLEFKGNEKLSSNSVGDVISASLGHWVDSNNPWSGLTIADVFNVPKHAVVVEVEGVENVALNKKSTTFELEGSSAGESFNNLKADWEPSTLADVDFTQDVKALSVVSEILGEIPVAEAKSAASLKPELHSEDKEILQVLSSIDALAKQVSAVKKLPGILIVRVNLNALSNAHGEKSTAVSDAQKLLVKSIENLLAAAKAADPNVLFAVVSGKADASVSRSKRATDDDKNPNPWNKSEYYNEDYPVIFNIILWFMVVFGLSLLAISYAIAGMDPGRDSIIYRMTSTRMKKDN